MKRNIIPINFKLNNKSTINSEFLNDRVKRFFRNHTFETRFISIITKISANNGSFWRSIARRTIIDLHLIWYFY